MSTKDGYDSYCLFMALKLHFTSESYDAFKYGFKTRTNPASYEKRRDKHFFDRIGKKYSGQKRREFLLANFLDNPSKWIGQFQEPCYASWRKRIESLSYHFEEEMKKVRNHLERSGQSLNNLFENDETGHPPLVKLNLEGEVSNESFLILDNAFGIIDKFDNSIQEQIIWPKLSQFLRKYDAFFTEYSLSVNHKKILIKTFIDS